MKPVKMLLSFVSLLAAAALGMSSLVTPPAPTGVPATEFSAQRAALDIQALSKDAHANDDAEAIAQVRRYLVTALLRMGIDAETRAYERSYKTADGSVVHAQATDVCGALPGRSDRSILLVAHYDSNPGLSTGQAPGSHGASDDGYGVAVILETLRCLKARGEQQNTVRVVFTDAAETTMLGSSAIAMDPGFRAADSVTVFNIESRGFEGPAVLFETSEGNAALIHFYAANDPNPVSWSLAADVYRATPYRTDFTAFVNQGMRGLNFSNLYKIDDNHTPRDVYENVSLSAVQGYGEQILPLVAAFAEGRAPDTFKANYDMSWFTLMKGVLIRFPAWLNWVWLALASSMLALYMVLAHSEKKLSLKRLWLAPALMGFSLGAAAAGTGLAWLLAAAFGRPFLLTALTGIPGFDWIALACAAAVLALLILLFRGRLKKGWTPDELTVNAALLSFALAAAFTIALPGGAFLFSFGAIFACLFGMLALKWRPFGLFTGFAACWIAAPVLATLLVALSFGSLGAVLALACFPLMFFAASIAGVTMEPCPITRKLKIKSPQ
jgi:hypothetical protein